MDAATYSTDDVNGACISGRRNADGGGWCWHCGKHHPVVQTKRTPCCGDCWFDTSPDEFYALTVDRRVKYQSTEAPLVGKGVIVSVGKTGFTVRIDHPTRHYSKLTFRKDELELLTCDTCGEPSAWMDYGMEHCREHAPSECV